MQYTMRDALITRFDVETANELLVEAGKLAGSEFCKNVLNRALEFNEFIADLQEKLKSLRIGVLRIEKADLEKMAAAGSTEDVRVCAQYDSFGSETAYRWVAAKPDESPSEPEPIGAVNTGQPSSLSDFIAWAGARW